MTAKELDTMVKAMNTKYHKVESRLSLEDGIYYLQKGLFAIGKIDLGIKLAELYSEIDSIDTNELIKLGTFN